MGHGVPKWWIMKYAKGLSSNRYWRMSNVLGSAITNDILHEKLGLLGVGSPVFECEKLICSICRVLTCNGNMQSGNYSLGNMEWQNPDGLYKPVPDALISASAVLLIKDMKTMC